MPHHVPHHVFITLRGHPKEFVYCVMLTIGEPTTWQPKLGGRLVLLVHKMGSLVGLRLWLCVHPVFVIQAYAILLANMH